MLQAILIDKGEGKYTSTLSDISEDQLPDGDVTVNISYSTLNYKDALAITGKGPIVRKFPMVPGIDFVGTVATSNDPDFKPGDKVILNGWGVGEQHWGGLAQKARVKGEWLIHLPENITDRQAMAIGTGGYTAMLSVLALERFGITPTAGPILVTGANGGVGSVSISLLSKLGYQVIAATGRTSESDYLKKLGATEIIDRTQLSEAGKPLQKERWAGAIDSVGSHTLANVCAGTMSDGAVAACGMAQGLDLPASVAPFILRGVALLGINSVTRPRNERVTAWNRLATDLDASAIEDISNEITLNQAITAASDLIDGKVRGRLIVRIQNEY